MLYQNDSFEEETISLKAIICKGHQGASGTGTNFGNTCEGGSIRAQLPFFYTGDIAVHLGTEPFCGTLNCYIGKLYIDETDEQKFNPLTYIHEITKDPKKFNKDMEIDPAGMIWDHQLMQVKWHSNFPPENFFFLKGSVTVNNKTYPCYIYYPDPSTKPNNPIPVTVIEIIAPPISFPGENVYGQKVVLHFPKASFTYKAITISPGPLF